MTMMTQAVTYQPSDDDKRRMEQWRRMMDKQRSQGGIIDLSKDPHLVDWNWVGASIVVKWEDLIAIYHIWVHDS